MRRVKIAYNSFVGSLKWRTHFTMKLANFILFSTVQNMVQANYLGLENDRNQEKHDDSTTCKYIQGVP